MITKIALASEMQWTATMRAPASAVLSPFLELVAAADFGLSTAQQVDYNHLSVPMLQLAKGVKDAVLAECKAFGQTHYCARIYALLDSHNLMPWRHILHAR